MSRVTEKNRIDIELVKKAFANLCTAKAMAFLYEENFKVVSKYVHATSRGHEAIQTAVGMQLLPQDYVFPYFLLIHRPGPEKLS